MGLVVIGGTATGATALPAYSGTVDGANDLIPIYQNSTLGTYSIPRNTFLNLASAPAGLTDTQNMSNKTLATSTLTAPVINGNITGTYTLAGTPTFPASVTTLTGSQTLTNKTLTSPTINSPTITNATLSSDAITGYTTSNAGSIFGVAITGGNTISTAMTLSSTLAVTGATTLSSTLAVTGAVTLSSTLAVSGIIKSGSNPVWQYLGYAQITGGFTTTSGTVVQVTGLTVTVTVPTGATKVKITAVGPQFFNTTSTARADWAIWSGTVGSGTQLYDGYGVGNNSYSAGSVTGMAVIPAVAGSQTYNVGMYAENGGTATLQSASTNPAFILVECC